MYIEDALFYIFTISYYCFFVLKIIPNLEIKREYTYFLYGYYFYVALYLFYISVQLKTQQNHHKSLSQKRVSLMSSASVIILVLLWEKYTTTTYQ